MLSEEALLSLRTALLADSRTRYGGVTQDELRAAIDAGRHPILLGGKQTNDFTYIDDVVAANLAAIDANPDAWNSVYNIGTGVELSALDAGRIICDVFGYHGEIDVKPPRSVDPLRFVYDVSRAERYLGFRAAFGFRDGLERMVQEAAA